MDLPAIRRRHAAALLRCKPYTVVRRRDGQWYVGLRVGNQSFEVNNNIGRSRPHAEWMRIMVCAALYRLLVGRR